MIFLDTSVWIEFLKAKEPFVQRIRPMLEAGEFTTSELVFAELFQGVKSHREQAILERYWQNLPRIDVRGVFIEAGRETARLKWLSKGIGIIDAAILISVIKSGARLWTLDKKLAGLVEENRLFKPGLE
jgi:predicted nucleic acid-binding protein